VVISHVILFPAALLHPQMLTRESKDPTLKRCFGIDRKIIDCDYSYVRTLRTLEEPHLPMPTLEEVVEFVLHRDVWLLLDIKVDNVADDVMRLTAEAIESVHGGGARYWGEKIVLGCWTLKFLPVINFFFGDPVHWRVRC
jgi:hypothetical protein